MDSPAAEEEQTRNPKLEPRKPEAISFRTSEGIVTIELRGGKVMVIEGLPANVDSKSVLKSMW